MVGRIAVSVLSSLLLIAPHVACADTRKTPVKAPATTTATTKAKPPTTPAPTPPPVPTPAPTTVVSAPGGSACVADPRTEVACLRRENEELRQKLNSMVAAEAARKERMAKQLGGGQAIEALR